MKYWDLQISVRSPFIAAIGFFAGPLLALLASVAPIQAQDVTKGADDANVVHQLDLERAKPGGAGLVIVASGIINAGCIGDSTEIGRIVGGKYVRVVQLAEMSRFLGRLSDVGPKGLPAGEYVIGAVHCRALHSHIINGPHAKFQVRAGEIVDVGLLWLEGRVANILTLRGSVHRSIVETAPIRLTALRQALPRTMARLVKRPMTLIGPPEVETKPRGSIF